MWRSPTCFSQKLTNFYYSPGYNYSKYGTQGWTALATACIDGQKDVVQLLLDHSERIDPNARNNHGITALMYACFYGRKDIVQVFLDNSKRIDLNARDNYGRTALMIASQKGHQDIVQLIKGKLIQ